HRALAALLDHLPPRLHLVIASREDPPLPLARLRARGELAELRAADLRFTPEEAAAFLIEARGLPLSVEDAAALAARTEGWTGGRRPGTRATGRRTRPCATCSRRGRAARPPGWWRGAWRRCWRAARTARWRAGWRRCPTRRCAPGRAWPSSAPGSCCGTSAWSRPRRGWRRPSARSAAPGATTGARCWARRRRCARCWPPIGPTSPAPSPTPGGRPP